MSLITNSTLKLGLLVLMIIIKLCLSFYSTRRFELSYVDRIVVSSFTVLAQYSVNETIICGMKGMAVPGSWTVTLENGSCISYSDKMCWAGPKHPDGVNDPILVMVDYGNCRQWITNTCTKSHSYIPPAIPLINPSICPPTFKELLGYCLSNFSTPLTYCDAQIECMKLGAQLLELLVVESNKTATFDYLFKLLGVVADPSWLGAFVNETEVMWNSGPILSLSRHIWDVAAEPPPKPGYCVIVSQKKKIYFISKQKCSLKLTYFCNIPSYVP